ncbi:MAG: DNA polymerase IV [Micropruina sp.]|nr:MAG: DNA polymerase IV [Micropruina sp.]
MRSFDPADLLALAEELRARLTELTGGLTASVGIGSSKFIAKVASELAKPNGVRIVQPGTEVATIAPLPARSIPGVGPVTMERLSRLGVRTIGDLQGMSRGELVRELGKAAGEGIAELAFARDDRSVEAERETKSISVEDTFEHDLRDRAEIDKIIERDAADVARRLAKAQLFARTITLKARHPDFTTFTRSRTLNGATDRAELIAGVAKGMLHGLDLAPGLRLLGVGVAGFTQIAQEALFDLELDAGPVTDETHTAPAALSVVARREAPRTWVPGMDVQHAVHGPGWVWGAGLGRVTVRFETAETGPGPVRTLAEDDPDLSPRDP